MTARRNEAQLITKELVKKYKPQKVILFGSTARGSDTKDSDIDLLVVKNTSLIKPYRIKEVFMAVRGLKRQFSLDVSVYTPKELKARQEMGDYFIEEVLTEGEVLYG